MRSFDVDERRVRLGVRHGLSRPRRSVDLAAEAIVGFHSSDPASVFLSAWARVARFTPGALERSLYERRTLVRILGMRRTLFVVPAAFAGTVDAACTKDLVRGETERLRTMLASQGVTDDAATWLDDVEARTLAALERRGEAGARTLVGDVPELGTKLSFGEGTRWAGTVGVSTRVLFLLATEGRIVRTRPAGSWASGQYRWAPTDRWLGAAWPPIEPDEARAELLRRWLRAFGPATTTDVRWWTGWTARRAAAALDAVDAVEVGLDGGSGWALGDDLGATATPPPWVALLPSLDATVMGWKEREWFLGPHAPALFDRNGNAGPTVWADGRVIGGWAQGPGGEVRVRLLERVPSETADAVDAERARLERWLGDVRVRPRFRTPLERELSD